MDISSFLGILLAVAGILLGLLIEGGHIGQVLQPTAAMIVLGGTAGAVMLQFPLTTVASSFTRVARIFLVPRSNGEAVLKQLVGFAHKARRNGIVSLDNELGSIQDPFLKQALMLAVDGTEPSELRAIMELRIHMQLERDDKIPALYEAAGGFSPTIGIIGAVLGLIQVMQHLDHIEEVGKGIAVAFVATIYGVGLANILLLPAAGKLRQRIKEEQSAMEMTLEGVISILEGMNPNMMEIKLSAFLGGTHAAPGKPTKVTRGAA
ncbi:flagellar motor protein [Silvibacterium dinghuense]|uniref:Flagellar motor protein n=1 Tax=Silvibacterium dinghuense TaxID=1560006 RepID=A0A4Q1SDT5_9BACT|nr:flagellar motor protein [Silvibacterium dinghuense]RXS95273.1 flagellar motor protein [Silvibacterium dinghuense]GGH12026.1 flagellar motor protein [Silvibacterium dinghuense]